MKRLVAAALASILLAAPGLSHAATLRPTDADGLNLRSGPGTANQIVAVLGAKEYATVLGEQSGWYRVRTPGGLEGWASADFSRLTFYDEVALAYVNTDVLNVRAEPSTTAELRAQIKANTQVLLLEQVNGWWKIRLSNATEGWVSGEFMRRTSSAPTPQPPAPTPPAPTPPPGTTPPTTPPTPPPTTPPTTPPGQAIPQTPPAAPPSALPVLQPLPAIPPVPVGAKEGLAVSSGSLYFGRNTKAFGVTGTVKAGEKLTFLDSAEGWWKVQNSRGERGWITGAGVVVTEGNLTYSIAEGRWTLGYTGPASARAKAAMLTVKNNFALFIQDSGEMSIVFKGDQLELLETQSPFLRVKTAQGRTGLIPAEAVTLAATADAQNITDALVATLRRAGAGILRLDVEAKGKALGQITAQGNTLTIPIATGQTETRILPVGDSGVQSVAITPTGLQINFVRIPGYQVTPGESGKVSVTLRPTLKGVETRTLPDRTVLDVKVDGIVNPVATAAGATITLDLPGVTAAQNLPVPAGVKAEATATGARLTITSKQAYAVKRSATGVEVSLYNPGLKDKVILIDPGHGGFDPGAGNAALGITEQNVNLGVALRLRAQLEAKGAKVFLTRIADTSVAPAAMLQGLSSTDRTQVDLSYRTRMANELKVDLFLSIHHNSGDRFAGGTEVYYTADTLNGNRSAELAKTLQTSLVQTLGRRDRGARSELFYVTRNTDAPAALVEIAFLDHDWEARLSKTAEFQHQAAQGMIQALERFYAQRP